MSYLEINFHEVEGWNKLSVEGKELFRKVYKKHNSCQGLDYKKHWKPVKVKECKCNGYIKVWFVNGEWLHYYHNGTWG